MKHNTRYLIQLKKTSNYISLEILMKTILDYFVLLFLTINEFTGTNAISLSKAFAKIARITEA